MSARRRLALHPVVYQSVREIRDLRGRYLLQLEDDLVARTERLHVTERRSISHVPWTRCSPPPAPTHARRSQFLLAYNRPSEV